MSFSDAPDVPRNLQAVEVSRSAVTLEWEAPSSDGGSPVRGYIVERRQGFSSRFMRISRGLVLDHYYRDTTVFEDLDYEYRIAAENDTGRGNWCQPVGPIVARDLFGRI